MGSSTDETGMKMDARARVLLGAGLALLLTGCGASTPPVAATSPAQHRTVIEQLVAGHSMSDADWAQYQKSVRKFCADDLHTLGYDVAIFNDHGNLKNLMIDVLYTCPERLPDLRKALDQVAAATQAG